MRTSFTVLATPRPTVRQTQRDRLAKGPIGDERLYGYFPEFRGRVSQQDVKQAFIRIGAIRREELGPMFTDLPPEWGITDDIRIAWCDLVLGRAAFLLQNADRFCANL